MEVVLHINSIKDKNITFPDDYLEEVKLNGITSFIFKGILSYQPTHCQKCGTLFDSKFKKHGFKTSRIVIPKVSLHDTYLELKKQRYFVHVANPLLIKKYFDAEIRKGKTDRKDALKISRYGTEKWWLLQEHSKADQIYQDLQFLSREYNSFMASKIKLKVQLSNLIELSFPGLEKILKGHYFGLLLDFYEL